MSEPIKQAADVLAASVMGMTIVKWLPPLAALFTILWTGIRIYETKTVQAIVIWIRKSPED